MLFFYCIIDDMDKDNNKKANRKLFAGFDTIIIIAIIIVSVLVVFLLFKDSNNLKAVIKYNGNVIETYSLSEVKGETFINVDGDCKLQVKLTSDGVQVVESDCKDKLCVNMGKITRVGESIVCLPAKVSISLEDNTTKSSIDSVVG